MDFSDWFDFNNRVKQDTILVKTVNGKQVTKKAKGTFNWLAFFFTWFYALCSNKYKTQGFSKKVFVPFAALCIIGLLITFTFGSWLNAITGVIGNGWFAFMFDTWYKNQLVTNGYHVEDNGHVERNAEQHDFE